MTTNRVIIHSALVTGVTGRVVRIEAEVAGRLPETTVTGLPATATREARDRVRAAIINSGVRWPGGEITVSVSPAVPAGTGGSPTDLAIALAILAADGAVPACRAGGALFLAELGLDGAVRPVRGVLPSVTAAARAGARTVVAASGNAAEAARLPGMEVIAASSLAAVLDWMRDVPGLNPHVTAAAPYQPVARPVPVAGPSGDLAGVTGQLAARRALEVCAAGGHHLSLLGPAGSGKTLLAGLLPGLMPPLDRDRALEVTAVHSAAGMLPADGPLLTRPPFQAPHYTASRTDVIGGSGRLRPGAASLAHRGVLFLDQAPEFARDVLDALRQPLESGSVTIARAGLTMTYPAQFTLVLASGPSPCPAGPSGADCACTPLQRQRYLAPLSGPLLDRADLKVRLDPPGPGAETGESSAVVATRVASAMARAAGRLTGTPWRLNSEIPAAELRRKWPPAPGAFIDVDRAVDLGQISARAAASVLRVSWTLADLAGKDRPGRAECGEALSRRLGVAG